MNDTEWILLDTETTGLVSPIFVVELGAQKMKGYEPIGEPFRRLINHNASIPPEASRVHGYTTEILERDGSPPLEVYDDFKKFALDLPVVAYNLEYDWDKVLVPEWKRLGIDPIGRRGFCALRLAQRLLDPVPAGNCKLQTLRQYYRLPEQGAHTALGDVMTVCDLMSVVLRPIAEDRYLGSFDEISDYACEEWFPVRIAFGKHKGRSILEAKIDPELRGWIEWLCDSKSERSRRMGVYYLNLLKKAGDSGEDAEIPQAEEPIESIAETSESGTGGIVIYRNPDVERLKGMIEVSRERLAGLESEYVVLKARVDGLSAKVFQKLKPLQKKRDYLKLRIKYRQTFLDTLLREGEEQAEQVREDFKEAEKEHENSYEETSKQMEGKRELDEQEEKKLNKLWKKLVSVFHPDRHHNDPKKREAYEKLTSMINNAKENGDIEMLDEIAEDPSAFMMREGLGEMDVTDDRTVEKLRRLWDYLQMVIIETIEGITTLKESPSYELCELIEKKPETFDEIITEQSQKLEEECGVLEQEADALNEEIEELSDDDSGV